MISYRLATESDAAYVGSRIRETDARELAEGSGELPVNACVDSVSRSLIAWAAVQNGNPVAVFGVGPAPGDSSVGVVWFLATEAAGRSKEFLRGGRYYVGLMARLFPVMYNALPEWNIRSRAWLRRLGFTEEQRIEQYGKSQSPFILCVYRKPSHV